MTQADNDVLLAVEGLRIRFDGPAAEAEKAGGTGQDVVRGVSFCLRRGRVLGIVGESGSGKSLTARALMGLLPAGARICGGTIEYGGNNLAGLDDDAMRLLRGRRIAMLFQDPLSSFNPLHRIGRQIGETLAVHSGWKTARIRRRVASLLEQAGMDEPQRIMDSFPHQLSGGQRQRAMLAMALAGGPEILIADEPTTALDAAVQRQVIDLLLALRASLGLSLVVISHDLPMMRLLADDLCVMQDGCVVESGPAERVFAAPQHPYTRMLLDSGADEQPVPVDAAAPEVLRVQGLDVRYPAGQALPFTPRRYHHAVRDVSFTVRRGECLGVVGESGSGKSSLGLAVLRLIRSQGSILFEGAPLHTLDEKQLRPRRSRLQIVFQDPLAALNPRLSVQECIAEGLHARGELSRAETEERVIRAMREVELDPAMRHRYPHEFSGGQCQRVCLARALVMQPGCIVFDEPTSSLDRNTQFQVVRLLRALQQRHGMAGIFIAHDLSLVRRICHRVLVMQGGQVVEAGDTATVFAAPRHAYTRRLLEAAPAGLQSAAGGITG
ncbi:Nickel-transporting ATPase., Fe(3+)-transporting ATPase [Oleidesulfovibrio alaskensis G20]|uniref:Nickel-transporting ATPase., Fe(3+)-transporting ATPase n=1 Tax=Oleidesulfovibrio alaskensis (strain ATCC BAA-1058 / DSM 17464 / G20) TaxID=207559 RepID=Q315Z4_OLEA2|nr:dipeptide ABC transporter ATP-binding protein [Oleidesulfovibrio alaskensis]ABB37252.1 Nickel-transporting ATPase., Fe(3+)-transporting ATPase [Oleidesulfovibrio alaskensis G20]MBG0772566.1 ABC transporter ATP-binding protein [Oleidesulfovibrio alaskensis]